jgi:hypothetical protein
MIGKPASPAELVNATCQHYLIDNETARCEKCQEQMIGIAVTTKTVLSAPNIAACRDPEHLAAIERGEDPQCSAVYVPGRATPVVVGYDPTYECERCSSSGASGISISYVQGEPVVMPCGRDHRGVMIRAAR